MTHLEKLKQLDATLKEYMPVLGSILDCVAPALFIGFLVMVVVGGTVLAGFAAWRASTPCR